jgi:ADP-ribose pyrophosphatase YjhB (NUDIX family)
VVIVFLDIDGVLRRLRSPRGRFEVDCLAWFEDAVRRTHDIRIVISSTWRLDMPLREIRGCFSPDVAQFIVDVTPEAARITSYYRYGEVLAYLKNEGAEGTTWIAVDDDPAHFPATAPTLLTDPGRGFDETASQALAAWIREHAAEPVTHCCAVPFRAGGDGLEVLLVMNREAHWTVPKVAVRPDATIPQAVSEAVLAQAGSIGKVCTVPVGRFRREEAGRAAYEPVYLVRVEPLLDPHSGVRETQCRAFSFDAIAEYRCHPGLRPLVARLPESLQLAQEFQWVASRRDTRGT